MPLTVEYAVGEGKSICNVPWIGSACGTRPIKVPPHDGVSLTRRDFDFLLVPSFFSLTGLLVVLGSIKDEVALDTCVLQHS
jgi:hypothetical protein